MADYRTENSYHAAAILSLTGCDFCRTETINLQGRQAMVWDENAQIPKDGKFEIVYTSQDGGELRAPLLSQKEADSFESEHIKLKRQLIKIKDQEVKK